MSAKIASIVTILVMAYLFLADRKTRTDSVSKALLVPYAWMLIAGSRFISQWLEPNATFGSADVSLDGSPIDRAVFLILIMFGIAILVRRNLDWKVVFRKNISIVLFLLFGFVSILWSDYTFVSFKRWIKALGTPIMALIILTEERPLEAISTVVRRLSYVLLPLSVLYIKYYPHLGRTYHMGQSMFTGVATQKNGLGQICLVVGIYYCWDILFNRHDSKELGRGHRFLARLLILPMLGWLLYMADSSTSLMCLIIAIGILIVARTRTMTKAPGKIIRLGFTALVVVAIIEITLGVSAHVITALGRDPTLTTRVPMWYTLLSMAHRPLIGAGYESFWLGRRLPMLRQAGVNVLQAHNGYLETYLNIGLIGVGLILAVIISGLAKIRVQMHSDYPLAALRTTFLVVVVAYNWTEATLFGVSNMWLLFFLAVLDASKEHSRRPVSEDQSPSRIRPDTPVSLTRSIHRIASVFGTGGSH